MLKHVILVITPYKLQIVEELNKTDFAWWKNFCKQFLHLQLPEDKELFFNEEAYFKLNRCLNKQNMRYWLVDDPNWQITKSLHSE